MGHVLMENRNALVVDAALTRATGTSEREAALAMLARRKSKRRITLGADKAYDVTAFVEDLRGRNVTPHIAINGAVSKLGVIRKTALDVGPPASRAMGSAKFAASESKRCSAGSRRKPDSPKSRFEAAPRSRQSSPSRSPPTI